MLAVAYSQLIVHEGGMVLIDFLTQITRFVDIPLWQFAYSLCCFYAIHCTSDLWSEKMQKVINIL